MPSARNGIAFEKNIGRIAHANHVSSDVASDDTVTHLDVFAVRNVKRHPASGVFHQYIVNPDMLGMLDERPAS